LYSFGIHELMKQVYLLNLYVLFSGVLNTGLGEVQLNSLLTTMNVPPISPNNLKIREKEVGDEMIKYARELCAWALGLEYEM